MDRVKSLFHVPSGPTVFDGNFPPAQAEPSRRCAAPVPVMMCEPEYVDMFEAMVVDDHGEKENRRSAAGTTSTGAGTQLCLGEAIRQFCSQTQQQPGVTPQRAGLSDVSTDTVQPTAAASSVVPPASEVVTVDTSEELLEPPTVDTLKELIKRMFTDPTAAFGLSCPSLPRLSYRPAASSSTRSRRSRSSSPPRRSRRSSASARSAQTSSSRRRRRWAGCSATYVAGTRQLLTEEARPIGKNAGTQATELKQELDRIKGAAKTRKSKAKSKGASAEEIAAMDTKAKSDSAAFTETECKIKHMPAANTVIVERRAPKPKPDHRRHALMSMLGSDEAMEAILAAEKVESAEQDLAEFDEEGRNPVWEESSEELEHALVSYKHALTRLKAAFPDVLNDCSDIGTCEIRRPCPCGRGLRGAWPWVVQTPRRGYCELSDDDRIAKYGDIWRSFFSCAALSEERAGWEFMQAWSDPAARTKRLPNGERWMPEKRFRERSDMILGVL